ncbi:MAG: SixA phosphatase family protein [Egibacteraceae bacterium]
MALLIVRHAQAGSRRDWDGPDWARPLSPKGRRQADGLVGLLAAYPIERILSSPSTRCVETVEPLARARGLTVETAAALGEASGVRQPLSLIRKLASTSAVLCSHGDVIPAVLDALAAENGLPLPADYPCAKGSTWVLQARDSALVEAAYLPPTH